MTRNKKCVIEKIAPIAGVLVAIATVSLVYSHIFPKRSKLDRVIDEIERKLKSIKLGKK